VPPAPPAASYPETDPHPAAVPTQIPTATSTAPSEYDICRTTFVHLPPREISLRRGEDGLRPGHRLQLINDGRVRVTFASGNANIPPKVCGRSSEAGYNQEQQ
jgi:hypothetical protein